MRNKKSERIEFSNWTFEFFRNKLETIEHTLVEIKHKENQMAQTLQDLQAAITAVGAAVDADAAQDQLVIAAIEKLLAAIAADPNSSDFTDEVAALSAASATLSGSNTGVQTELDKVASTGTTGTPKIDSVLTASGTVGLVFSYAITATPAPVSFAADTLPDGLTLDTSSGVISGTPTAAGDTSVNISATNPSGTGKAVLVVSVVAAA